jgi:CxxC motif-containing protein (DUF1111 family)
MPNKVIKVVLLGVIFLVFAGVLKPAFTETTSSATPVILPHTAYLQAVPGLEGTHKQLFRDGEKVFNTLWIAVPEDQISKWWDLSQPGPGGSEWGLGPTFLTQSCVSCHIQAGRGRASDVGGGPVFMQSLRLSIPGEGPHGGPNPEPNYGTQIQSFDSSQRENVRFGEAEVHIDWKPSRFTFPDGVTLELRQPVVRLEKLGFGPLAPNVMTSLRNSQAIFGLGYLEAVSEEDILALSKWQKTVGLNGRPNYVRDDVNDKISLGRFGWKANQPSLKQQLAAAFLGDIGITSAIYPTQNCTAVQQECLIAKHSGKAELRQELWDALTFWVTALDAPPQRDSDKPTVIRGEKLFESTKCSQCHVPTLTAGKSTLLPQLSSKTIRPYTDLLLHDMGPELADGRPDFKAGGRDWRTPPLWGIGLSKQVNGGTNFLHDGRARNLLEAVVWHGGEAAASRDLFAKLSEVERNELIAFLNSL